MRRVRLTVAATLAASLFLAGCGGDDKEKEGDAEGPKGVGDSPSLSSTWPLTGLDVGSDGSSEKKHPVLVVKVENTSGGAPQTGLGKADLVVEELVEGGYTRLAAFYYSQVPEEVGPVRSMRTSDVGIVKPVGGQLVTSGAAGPVIARLNKAGVKFHQEGATGFYRSNGGRVAPYNLFVNLAELASSVEKGDGARPDDYLPWGDAADLPQGQRARRIQAKFSPARTTEWTFRGGKYRNDNTHAADGDEFLADTVLVLRVRIGDAGYPGYQGARVPETELAGKGAALLFHKGRVVRGTWSKQGLGDTLTLRTKAGELTVPAGHVFIELVPAGEGAVTFN